MQVGAQACAHAPSSLTLAHCVQCRMSFRGASKCCVCKRFCSSSGDRCPGCDKHCHKDCRQSICCSPCDSCWGSVLQKRSCVCGKSLRSLGIFIERQTPLTPATSMNVIGNTPSAPPRLPSKRNVDRTPRDNARQQLHYDTDDSENQMRKEVCAHPHETSPDYLMQVHERGGNASRSIWEDCRILSKYSVVKGSSRETMYCTIEYKLRTDLNETSPWRPERDIK